LIVAVLMVNCNRCHLYINSVLAIVSQNQKTPPIGRA